MHALFSSHLFISVFYCVIFIFCELRNSCHACVSVTHLTHSLLPVPLLTVCGFSENKRLRCLYSRAINFFISQFKACSTFAFAQFSGMCIITYIYSVIWGSELVPVSLLDQLCCIINPQMLLCEWYKYSGANIRYIIHFSSLTVPGIFNR
jgi:hypothetical protein